MCVSVTINLVSAVLDVALTALCGFGFSTSKSRERDHYMPKLYVGPS